MYEIIWQKLRHDDWPWWYTQICRKGTVHMAGHTYLIGVHLEFAYDFDRHFPHLPGVVLGSVHIAESAITHLLDECPSFQARVFRQFALALPLLGHDPLYYRRVEILLPLDRASVCRSFLMVAGSLRGDSSGLCSDVAVIDIRGRVISTWNMSMLQWLVIQDIGVAYCVVVLGWAWIIPLVLCVDWCDIGSRLTVGWVGRPSLLAMTDEVLEVLYRRHGWDVDGVLRGRWRWRWRLRLRSR